jgi:Fe2+ or Zn2+ uptake regulation protein
MLEPEQIQSKRRATRARERILRELISQAKAEKWAAYDLLTEVAKRFYGMGYRTRQEREKREIAA